MKLRPAERLLADLDKAYSYMRGTVISREEYELIRQRIEELDRHVLYPAAIRDINSKRENESND